MSKTTSVAKYRVGSRQRRRGAAAVEFAIVAPIFVLLVFGLIEYGRMAMAQQVLVNATREGARAGIVENATAADVSTAVVNYCDASGITLSTSQVQCIPADPSTAGAGDPITVTVNIPFTSVSWLPSPMYLGATQLTATSVMRKESSQ